MRTNGHGELSGWLFWQLSRGSSVLRAFARCITRIAISSHSRAAEQAPVLAAEQGLECAAGRCKVHHARLISRPSHAAEQAPVLAGERGLKRGAGAACEAEGTGTSGKDLLPHRR